MPDHVYKKLEITGTSTKGIEDAITNAIKKASKTVHNLKWFEIIDVRGDIAAGAVSHWQVTIKAGFTLDD
jgi:flavin-binding protein dodecin